MFLNYILFPFRKFIFPGGIFQCFPGVIKAMELMGIFFIGFVPVIEEIIVEQRASDKLPAVTADTQFFTDGKTVSCHIPHMVVHGHVAMLNMLSCAVKIIRTQDIRRGPFDFPATDPVIVQLSLPAPGLSWCPPVPSIPHICPPSVSGAVVSGSGNSAASSGTTGAS